MKELKKYFTKPYTKKNKEVIKKELDNMFNSNFTFNKYGEYFEWKIESKKKTLKLETMSEIFMRTIVLIYNKTIIYIGDLEMLSETIENIEFNCDHTFILVESYKKVFKEFLNKRSKDKYDITIKKTKVTWSGNFIKALVKNTQNDKSINVFVWGELEEWFMRMESAQWKVIAYDELNAELEKRIG